MRGGVFGGFTGRIDALVLGGTSARWRRCRRTPRLRPYFDLAVDRFLTVPDPRLMVLQGHPRQFRAIRIRLSQPAAELGASRSSGPRQDSARGFADQGDGVKPSQASRRCRRRICHMQPLLS